MQHETHTKPAEEVTLISDTVADSPHKVHANFVSAC